MKTNSKSSQKRVLLFLLIAGITLLHYSTDQSRYYLHLFYGELYFLPILLAAFWFGLRGALFVSLTATVSYLPFIYLHWQGFSVRDLDRILSLVLYNGLGIVAGVLKGRELISREKLVQTENLAVLGRSLAAAAHDMRTPLMLIGGFARRILKKMDTADPAHPKLELIIKETEKMESMTGDMLDFAKPLTLNRIEGDCETVIRDSLAEIKEVAGRRKVTIEYKENPDVGGITFDSLRFEQVIVNLLRNAIEASPEGETVTVRILNSSSGDLVFEVADNGSGIPFVERQHIFDPFFTTKKEGTGLGLPIVKKIVDAHGWNLQVLDNTGGGTRFRVSLRDEGT